MNIKSQVFVMKRETQSKSHVSSMSFQFLIFFFIAFFFFSSSSFASLSPYFQNSFATLTLSSHLYSRSLTLGSLMLWFTSAFAIFSFFGFLVSWFPKLCLKIRGFQNFGKILVSKSFALSHNQFFVDFLFPKSYLLKVLILNLSSGQK